MQGRNIPPKPTTDWHVSTKPVVIQHFTLARSDVFAKMDVELGTTDGATLKLRRADAAMVAHLYDAFSNARRIEVGFRILED